MKRQLVIGLALVLGLAACSSTPDNRYYTLSAEPGPTHPPAATLTIASVHVPGVTDRPQMVLRTGQQTVDIKEFDRWAEPFDQMVWRVLAQDLTLRLGLPQPGQTTRRIYVTIDDFIGGTDGTAHLSGRWWALNAGDDPAQKREQPFAFSRPVSGDPTQVAAVMSTLLGSLADQIAEADTAKPN